MPRKVISVFGTRPEAIKMAPVVKALEEDPRFESKVLITAQHREMLDQVLEAFSISPDFDLDLMEQGQSLAQITERVLHGATQIFLEEKPDIVIVHGDTTTTFATALAAFYCDIDVAHVEAGMRTGDIKQPYPEEMNRVLVGRLARWHFTPSKQCADNLAAEGVAAESIIRTSHNTVVDALFKAEEIMQARGELENENDSTRKNILVTAHRRENWGAPMEEIFSAIAEVADSREDVHVKVAAHANPIVQNAAKRIFDGHDRIELIGHQGYLDFIRLMKEADLILSDSGGIQEEGPSLGVGVVVLRNKTEYQELLNQGVVVLAGTQRKPIIESTLWALDSDEFRDAVVQFSRSRQSTDSVSEILETLAAATEGK